MKHALIFYLSGLWETSDTLSSLRNGDADLLSDEAQVLDKIGMMAGEVRDQLSLAEHLSEVLASGLECLQSITIISCRKRIICSKTRIICSRKE